MQRRSWIWVLLLCVAILAATVQAVWADSTAPDTPAAATTIPDATAPATTTTEDWEDETDENGATIHPPRPTAADPTTTTTKKATTTQKPTGNTTTTTTKKTTSTKRGFQYNPDHPDDTDFGAVRRGTQLTYYEPETDEYGSVVTIPGEETEPDIAPEDDNPFDASEYLQQQEQEEAESETRQVNWRIGVAAGAALLVAAAVVVILLVKGKKDSDDEYFYD